MDWTEKKREEAEKTLLKWWKMAESVEQYDPNPSRAVIEALSDDLNTPKAISELHRLSNEGRDAELAASLELLGLFDRNALQTAGSFGFGASREELEIGNKLVLKWMKLRNDRNFEAADKFKARAASAGIELIVKRDGGKKSGSSIIHSPIDPSKLEGLL